MRHTLLQVLALFFITFAGAQNIDISGNVQDETGLPIPGANIIVKNTTRGTTTDFDGNFILTGVEKGTTIMVTFIGYVTKEIVISNNNNLAIKLQEDLAQLDEVVVVGYGTQKKKDVTGAVSIVSAATLEDLRPIDAAQALQGTSAGVSVTAPSGSPGGGFNILIRGVSSNGDNGPLIIIDGYKGDLNSINPSDIETFSILKDAQAAIYGIEGANGVVLVTTKTGKKNSKAKISYNGYTGIQETTRELPYLNATEYALILNESYAANGQTLPFPNVSGLGTGNDWQKQLFDTAPITNHSLSVTGGGERSTYYFGGSVLEQKGIVASDKSDFQRANAKIKLTFELSDKLKFTTSANYFNNNRKTIGENALGTPLFNALNYAPTYSLDQQDTSGFLGNEVVNPISQIANTYNKYSGNAIEGTFQLEYEAFEGFKITSRIGLKAYNDDKKEFSPSVNYGSGKVFNNDRSSVTQTKNTNNTYTWDTFATYNKVFGENHNTTFTLGTSAQRAWGDNLQATGFDVPNNSWEFADISLANGLSEAKSTSSYIYDTRLSSFFGRVQYDFKSKYLLSAMIRRDGASDFAPENRIDYFSSATAGWKISDEDFLQDSETINFLKLRASYGTLGNNVGDDLYRALLSGEATYVIDGALVTGTANGRIPNPDAQWETAEKLDIGLDMNLFNNKLEIVADYFVEDRNDLLIEGFPVSGIIGAGAPGAGLPTVNAGTTRNKGIELFLNYKETLSDKFSFGVSYNVTKIDGEVTDINGGVIPEGGSFSVGQPSISRMEIGQPIGYFYGLKTDGIFQNQAEVNAHPSQTSLGAAAAPGDIRFVDTNGDNEITIADRTYLGKPQADYIMGLNLNFDYKNFDFGAYMYAELGKETVRNYERDQPNVNRLNLYLNRWTGEGTSNTVPRTTLGVTNNKLFSDFYVEDSSFLRIQNIQLGYSLPQAVIEKLGISKFRLYASVNNAFTFTKYNGYDPAATNGDAIGGGIDYGFYPISRQFILGLNLSI
ncbi:TonB-dependent receptor [Algibacter amylolyticus]|uniref:TonB-dependent receptor n=1 Tax=Algibacter amylolyticus TaxID=1608400 RepID=A0A5M7BK66_9FLAO|nr:TonB-dependent receptor [Algibacter amylolyticus]KAA5827455.1 TonB-dependent receptor [Algibacter amylolyticus]MBB5266651.1 TonB-linked SusC/RagA family outer membrane protein [Algibacter amylolyticus]TSJ81700.1 TonB-dependent receptor [Algibacter amylolyticus]